MSYKSKTNALIALVVIAFILIFAIVGCLIASAIMNVNVICLFKHNYDDNGVCTRCGKEKPVVIENNVLATSASPLMANNYEIVRKAVNNIVKTATLKTDIPNDYELICSGDNLSTQANASAPTSYRPLKVGDDLNEVVSIAIDIWAFCLSRHSDNLQKLLFNTNNGEVDIFMIGRDAEFGFVDKDFTGGIRWDEDLSDEVAVGYNNYIVGDLDYCCIDAANPFYYIAPQYLGHTGHLTFGTTVTEVGEVPIYVKLVSKTLPAAPTKTGYTFTGWYTDKACTQPYTDSTVTSDITLYAGFRAHTYSIKFNANSGSGNISNLSMTYDEAKNLPENTFTKDHYALKGWATSADGDVVYSDKESVSNLTATDDATVELFAVWERSEVKVEFVSEGNTTTTWVAVGTKATLPENPSKEGHLFVGWFFEDGTEYTTQNLTKDTTLTAQFSAIKCTVTFIVDGEVYAVYVCDWGTSLAMALNDNNVNTLLMSVEGEYSRNF